MADIGSAVFLAVAGFLIFDGFVVNSSGDLTWHGTSDVERLVTVFVAVLVRGLIGWIYRAVARVRGQSRWTGSDQWRM